MKFYSYFDGKHSFHKYFLALHFLFIYFFFFLGGGGGGGGGVGSTNHRVFHLWSKVQYGNIMHQSFVSTAPSTYKDRWR